MLTLSFDGYFLFYFKAVTRGSRISVTSWMWGKLLLPTVLKKVKDCVTIRNKISASSRIWIFFYWVLLVFSCHFFFQIVIATPGRLIDVLGIVAFVTCLFVVFFSLCVSPAYFWLLILFLLSTENRYLVLSRCSYFVLDEVGGDHIQQSYSEIQQCHRLIVCFRF